MEIKTVVIYCPECGDMFELLLGIFLTAKPEDVCCSVECLEAYHSIVLPKFD